LDRSRKEEGVVKYRCEHSLGQLRPYPELRDLLAGRAELHTRSLIGEDRGGVGYGNVSIRLQSSPRFLISGTQTSGLAEVDPRHFAEVTVIDLDRNLVKSRGEIWPSSEALTHAALYLTDPSIGGVAHVHAEDLWRKYRDRLPTTDPHVEYGTPQMGYEMVRLHKRREIRRQGIVVMGGHRFGLIAFGLTLASAVQEILTLIDAS
jgi:hypothetical protein